MWIDLGTLKRSLLKANFRRYTQRGSRHRRTTIAILGDSGSNCSGPNGKGGGWEDVITEPTCYPRQSGEVE